MQAKLILFSGIPGTGEFTLANRFARALNAMLQALEDLPLVEGK